MNDTEFLLLMSVNYYTVSSLVDTHGLNKHILSYSFCFNNFVSIKVNDYIHYGVNEHHY